MKPILNAKGIHKSFGGVHALKNVDLTISEGQILCLVGENGCGKSTLVKILSGVYKPDSGCIELHGKEHSELSPREAIAAGIQVIFQDLSLFPHLSIAENIGMQHIVSKEKKLVNWQEIHDIAQAQLDKIGVSLDLSAHAAGLSVANKQIVAICRALSMEAKVLFMDEPTTALTKTEINALLDITSELSKSGVSVVFISHKLDEVFKIADRITVLRDGEKVGDFDPRNLDEDSLAFHMTGREIGYKRYHRDDTKFNSEPVLTVENLSRKGMYEDISFDIRKGDIVGLIGSLGSGRTELALSLFGLNEPTSGKVTIDGKKLNLSSPETVIEHDIALLPEDRLSEGLFLEKSIKTNLSSSILTKLLNPLRLIDHKRATDLARNRVKQVRVNRQELDLAARKLSGGNQQKVVLGKWLATEPKVLLLDTPTVGVDIGSKAEIYDIIHEEAECGMGVLLISDEIKEITNNCNRILVIRDGKIHMTFEEEDIMRDDIQDLVSNALYEQEGEINDHQED